MEILVFGGTVEGRELAEWLSARGTCEVVVCTATDYGSELVAGLTQVETSTGPLDDDAKERLIASHDFACIVDATHPFAAHVTVSVSRLAAEHGIPLLRLVREDESEGSFMVVESVEEAAALVAGCDGNILLTTGTKDLETFASAIPDFEQRLYARVLPVVDSVGHALKLGLPASHLIAMQGPFSVALNEALMQELSIKVMVTKASGSAGGFPQKIEATKRLGVEAIVIGRPIVEKGYSLDEVKAELEAHYGV